MFHYLNALLCMPVCLCACVCVCVHACVSYLKPYLDCSWVEWGRLCASAAGLQYASTAKRKHRLTYTHAGDEFKQNAKDCRRCRSHSCNRLCMWAQSALKGGSMHKHTRPHDTSCPVFYITVAFLNAVHRTQKYSMLQHKVLSKGSLNIIVHQTNIWPYKLN